MKAKISYHSPLKHTLTWPFRKLRRYWQVNLWNKFLVICFSIGLVFIGSMYGISRWYIWTERNDPLTMGASFIPDYAQYLGLNPQQTMDAMINDLHVKQFRLTSYWSDIEATPGHYNFTQLDWEFQKADAAHATVSLSIGLRQPRWPECHMPSWADNEPVSVWQPQLEQFMTAVIQRYQHNPALQSYQLENEYFLKDFGSCTNFSRQRFVDEYNLVKKLDPSHPIILSRSDNNIGWPVNAPQADEYGISIYRRVWMPLIGRYIEYPFPTWYYSFLAGMEKIWSGKNTIVHELQAEPWPPDGKSITQISLAEQNKTMNASRFIGEVNFAKATGMKTIDLWGAEYWYYRKEILHDPSLWNAAKQEFQTSKN